MRRVRFLILTFVFVASIPSTAFSEDVFAPVRKVYMNDGKIIECQMGWLDGARMICRKFGGNMTLPLQNVDFEKTFPKYKKPDGETVLLVHPGPRYQDENIVLSNLRVIRASESPARNDPSTNKGQTHPQAAAMIVLEIVNRGDPCEVRVVINTLDVHGKVLHQFEVTSDSRLDTGESSILKRRLDRAGADLENQMSSLKVSQVERLNVLESVLNGKSVNHSATGSSADRVREEKIKALKEIFLRDRAPSP